MAKKIVIGSRGPENPLQFMGRALARIPRLTAIAVKSTREPPCMQLPYCPCPFLVR